MKTHRFALAAVFCFAPAAMTAENDPPASQKPQPLAPAVTVAPPAKAPSVQRTSTSGEYFDAKCEQCGCNHPCNSCVWAYAEYLHWWSKGDDTPTLLTQITATPGAPTTTEAFGGGLNDRDRSGVRFGVGFYPHCLCRNVGVEVDAFSFGARNDDQTFNTPNGARLTRPFIDAQTGRPAELLVGDFAQRLNGQATADHTSRFYGGRVGLRHRITRDPNCGGCEGACVRCLDVQYGYQHYQLNETLAVQSTQVFVGAQVPTSQTVREEFDESNRYHGAYLGLSSEYNCGTWFYGGNIRGGVGGVQNDSRIRGATTNNVGAGQIRTPIGTLLALPSNIGDRDGEDLTWAGEVGGRIGCQPTCWFRAYLGYTMLYVGDVNRPGGTVNPTVNRAQLAAFGAAPFEPRYTPRRESFWAHGFSGGAEIRY